MAMDAERMSIYDLTLAVYFTSGIVAGALYFTCLWWNVRLFAERGGTLLTVLLLLGRIAVLACVLILAARQGALPLLVMALGVFVARFAVMRGLGAAAP
jgi:F1F0 ATPase subunit 2